MVLFFAALAVCAVLVILRENTDGGEAEAAGANLVVMENISYSPTSLAVRKGAEVTFDNRDVAPHTITADNGTVNSGLINPGKAFRLVVNEPFSYFCELHPSMKAEIIPSG
jgi:plastocyanin